MYRTKSYQIESPRKTWKEFKQIHEDRDRINSRVVELVAQDVLEHRDGDLDPQVQAEINRILGGNDGV